MSENGGRDASGCQNGRLAMRMQRPDRSTRPMSQISSTRSQAYLETLLSGDRAACRSMVDAALKSGVTAYTLLTTLVWPTMELLQQLYREDRISVSALNLATRLNRSMTDQISGRLDRSPSNDKKVLIFCGNDEPEELGGQITAELF